jgi:ATP/maltotriose-dependent transcriptional regulator MalT
MEILSCIANGASNQEIAETLVIAPNTVKRHIGHILAKLGVSNRTQALVQARKIGLISSPCIQQRPPGCSCE